MIPKEAQAEFNLSDAIVDNWIHAGFVKTFIKLLKEAFTRPDEIYYTKEIMKEIDKLSGSKLVDKNG